MGILRRERRAVESEGYRPASSTDVDHGQFGRQDVNANTTVLHPITGKEVKLQDLIPSAESGSTERL